MRAKATLCLVWVSLLSGSASASVANEARFFDDTARRAYESGHYREALDAFLQVNEIAPSPAALYNIAVTAELAKRVEVAFVHYREYLAGVDSNQERRSDAEKRLLKLKRGLALVDVDSSPAGATIYIDRVALGAHGTTPSIIVADPGKHVLLLKAPGHAEASLPVTAVKGATASVRSELEVLFGEVSVRSTPASAELVFLQQGKPVRPLRAEGKLRLPVGAYNVQVAAAGYAPREVSVSVSEAAPVDVSVELDALPPHEGTLLVSCDEPAEVYVDGARAAQTPATLRVPVGVHRVEVRAKHGKPFTTTVTVNETTASYVEASLRGKR